MYKIKHRTLRRTKQDFVLYAALNETWMYCIVDESLPWASYEHESPCSFACYPYSVWCVHAFVLVWTNGSSRVTFLGFRFDISNRHSLETIYCFHFSIYGITYYSLSYIFETHCEWLQWPCLQWTLYFTHTFGRDSVYALCSMLCCGW